MKRNFMTKNELPIGLRYYLAGAVALWSILIGLSLAWNLKTQESGILEAARIEARTAFKNLSNPFNAERFNRGTFLLGEPLFIG